MKNLYTEMTSKEMKSEMAMLTLARKIAAVVLAIWKKGEEFDEKKLSKQVA